MKEELISKIEINARRIDIYARNGSGADFWYDENKHLFEIAVGIDDCWEIVHSSLIHEAIELSMTLNGNRYQSTRDYATSHDQYTFIMTHPEFSNICMQASYIIIPVFSKLKKIWQREQKNAKKK